MIHHCQECASTQDWAWEASPSLDSTQGEFFVARRQSAGRGRGAGRRWDSPEGGLYLSWRLPPTDPAGLTLLGGLAVAKVVAALGIPVRLKWPNDCWIGSAKVAGVLSDARWQGQRLLGSVMGIGVNVEVAEADLPAGATSVHLHVSRNGVGLPTFTHLLVDELLGLLQLHRQQGLAGYLDEVRAFSLAPGTVVRYWLMAQSQPQEGVVRGLTDQGFLALEGGVELAAVERLQLL